LIIDLPYVRSYLSVTGLVIVSALLVSPFTFAKDLSALAAVSSTGLFCIILNIIAVLVYGFYLYGDRALGELLDRSGYSKENTEAFEILHLFPTTYADATSFFGVAVFCFGICAFAFPIQETMANNQEFPRAVVWCLLLVCTLYVAIGDGGASLYNYDLNGIEGNILLNLPIDSVCAIVARLSMATVSTQCCIFNVVYSQYSIQCMRNSV
jgi:Transmembrane amino acid transporter protein